MDRPGVLGNYIPVHYHCLYDLSVHVLVEGINRVYTLGSKYPAVKHKCYTV